jgi:hypothetical protein
VTGRARLNTNHAPTLFLHDEKDPTVHFDTMQAYSRKLKDQFPSGNPAYTVNGIREEFMLLDTFEGEALPDPGHQWSDELTGDANNAILKWFNSHR